MARGKGQLVKMRYTFDYTSQFKKDYRKLKNQAIIAEVDLVINKLLNDEKLEKKYQDHSLFVRRV